VTLIAVNPPFNSTFPSSVYGPSPVEGTFSFTPDFNQSGTFAATFSATDADGDSRQASVIITVNEVLQDRLFSTSAPGQKPVGGLRGTGGILFPINLITSQTVYGVQFDMRYPYSAITIDSFVPTNRIPEWVVYDNVGTTPGDIRVVTFGLANEPVETDTSSAILYAALTLDSNTIPWSTHVIYLEDGHESVNPDPNYPSLPLLTDSGVVEVDNPGDVNLDKDINVADAVNIVAKVTGNHDLNARQFATADLDVNDAVDVFDLMGVINLIYGIPISPVQGLPVSDKHAQVALSYDDLSAGGAGLMTVTSELPEQIAGVQLEINYDPEAVSLGKPVIAETMTDYNHMYAISYRDNGAGKLRVLMYHGNPLKTHEHIQTGVVDLLEIPIVASSEVASGDKSKLRLTEALLATAGAQSVTVDGVEPILPGSFALNQNYPNPFNPSTTIEFSINSFEGGLGAQHVTLDVFNVLGQKVRTLIDDILPVGRHNVTWEATTDSGQRVASGIYLYRLTIGSESRSKKMLFLK